MSLTSVIDSIRLRFVKKLLTTHFRHNKATYITIFFLQNQNILIGAPGIKDWTGTMASFVIMFIDVRTKLP